jgi:hypothetical protein
MFANVVSNNIVGTPTTSSGTGTGATTTGSSAVSNILLTTLGTSAAAESYLTIKAANADNLRAINNNATVLSIPIQTGTNVPPPPNYDPSVVVPLP